MIPSSQRQEPGDYVARTTCWQCQHETEEAITGPGRVESTCPCCGAVGVAFVDWPTMHPRPEEEEA